MDEWVDNWMGWTGLLVDYQVDVFCGRMAICGLWCGVCVCAEELSSLDERQRQVDQLTKLA